MSFIKVYNNIISKMPSVQSILVSQSSSRAKLHSIGEIDIATLRDADETNRLAEGVLLFIKADADDDAMVTVMYPDGVVNTIEVWKLKASCTEVVKIFAMGTTLDNNQMFLSK